MTTKMTEFGTPSTRTSGTPSAATGAAAGNANLSQGSAARSSISAEQREAFLEQLAATSDVAKSARAAGIATRAVHALRKSDETFAEQWQAALDVLPARVLAAVIDEAVEGREVVDSVNGKVTRTRNIRLLERLAEKHGVLNVEQRGPTVAIQNNNSNAAPRDPALVAAAKANSDKLRALLLGKPVPVIDAIAVDVTPVAAIPSIDIDEDLL